MPKMTFSDENKAKSQYEFPKLKLEMGERVRVSCIEGDPNYGFVHTLRAPQIVNGKAIKEMVSFKNKNGETEQREEMKTDFIGQHICIGDMNTLSEKGADIVNCPVCKLSKESDAVEGPKRRFSMNILRYTTQPGSFVILDDPFQAEITVWSFTDKVFNDLVELAKEWGNLQERDLNLGPCTGKQYQKFDINVANRAEWIQSDARKDYVKKIYQATRLEDLDMALGRKLTKDQVEEDLDKVITRYEIAMGRASSPSVIDMGQATQQINIADMLDSTPTEQPSVPSVASSTDLGGTPEADPVSNVQDEVTAAPKEDPADKLSLQSILDL